MWTKVAKTQPSATQVGVSVPPGEFGMETEAGTYGMALEDSVYVMWIKVEVSSV